MFGLNLDMIFVDSGRLAPKECAMEASTVCGELYQKEQDRG